MFADAQLQVGTDQLPSVPRSALVLRAGQYHVFVVAEGRLEERVVALGPAAGERASVQRGVKEGELVVVSDPNVLGNGQKVALSSPQGE
jgi:hypothetical protein